MVPAPLPVAAALAQSDETSDWMVRLARRLAYARIVSYCRGAARFWPDCRASHWPARKRSKPRNTAKLGQLADVSRLGVPW